MNSFRSRNSYLKLIALVVGFSGFALIYSCVEDSDLPESTKVEVGFVGGETCQNCHTTETNAWLGSHHDYAMKAADSLSVRGDFNHVRLTHNEEEFHFYTEGDEYFVEVNGKPYSIPYTFGWEPLQQYLIDFGQGKLQALNIAWDTEKKQWFALNPKEDLKHGDWLHWTGGAMNWNTMCADCHSTNLKQNYFAEADSFNTTWSAINVSCESCHGPGAAHVEFMESDSALIAGIERIRSDLSLTAGTSQKVQINQCAQCHARRQEMDADYDHTGDFLNHFSPDFIHPELYFEDGQIKDEVYVYGSFLQSKMYANGVKCSDCHDPHSLKLKASITDNTLCMSCHVPAYNSPSHTFHKANTEASQCVSCHMTGQTYMEVDFRRDHSFRVPRPDLSAEFGTPNACNSCHEDQTTEWAANAIIGWYGPERETSTADWLTEVNALDDEFPTSLKKVIADSLQPEMLRATLIWFMREFPDSENSGFLNELIRNESELIRLSAAQTLATYPEIFDRSGLISAKNDELKTVRIAAFSGLNGQNPEYEEYLEHNRYFTEGEMNRGIYYQKNGEYQKAMTAYKSAIEKNPEFSAARINLAQLYNRIGNNREAENQLRQVIEREPEYGPAYYSLALLLAEEHRLKESVSFFEKGAVLLPENHRLRYNLAITYQTLNEPENAERSYQKSIQLAPDQPDYLYGICTLYLQNNQPEKALQYAEKLVELDSQNQRFRQLYDYIKDQL